MTLLQNASDGLNRLWRTSSRTLPTREENLRRAEQQHLVNEAKVQSLMDLVQVDDFEQLAFDDREKVRQYEAATVKGRNPTPENGIVRRGSKGADDMGHILGDVTIEKGPNKNPISSVIVPLAAIGLAGAIAWKLLDEKPAAPVVGPPPTQNASDISTGLGFGEPVYVEPTN